MMGLDDLCLICGKRLPRKPAGRRRRYCSRACQQFAYRLRRRADVTRSALSLNDLLDEEPSHA